MNWMDEEEPPKRYFNTIPKPRKYTCIECGKEGMTKGWNRRYCSIECSAIAKEQRLREDNKNE